MPVPAIDIDQELQWGRDVIVAEAAQVTESVLPLPVLQWGRDVIVAEATWVVPEDWVERAVLQWGRDVIVAEATDFPRQAADVLRLQWGRDVIVAEASRGALVEAPQHGFNGAAT